MGSTVKAFYDEKMRVFEVPQISMRIPLMERASKTDPENGMGCHVSTNISRDIRDQKSEKMRKIADSAKLWIFLSFF